MFRKIFRWLFMLACIALLIWLLAPRLFDSAANSVISSASAAVQGQAQYIPGGVNFQPEGELQVNVTGLLNRVNYQLSLDQGQCGGTPSITLGKAPSDASGNLYFDSLLKSIDTTKHWFIDVWQNGTSVACGPLQTNLDTGHNVIDASQSGPNVFGPQTPIDTQPTVASSTPVPNSNTGATNGQSIKALPNTGADPGNHQQYDNNQYPRKY